MIVAQALAGLGAGVIVPGQVTQITLHFGLCVVPGLAPHGAQAAIASKHRHKLALCLKHFWHQASLFVGANGQGLNPRRLSIQRIELYEAGVGVRSILQTILFDEVVGQLLIHKLPIALTQVVVGRQIRGNGLRAFQLGQRDADATEGVRQQFLVGLVELIRRGQLV